MTLAYQGTVSGIHVTSGTTYAVNNPDGTTGTGTTSIIPVPVASPVTSAANAATNNAAPTTAYTSATTGSLPSATSANTGSLPSATSTGTMSLYPLLLVAIIGAAALIADREGWI
jgi:hypothetical protein